MKRFLAKIIFLANINLIHASETYQAQIYADWLVVGAGPAGIATVGVLIDIGVAPKNITWIDPEFNVGRLGANYGYVPANNPNAGFIKFINSCNVFQECNADSITFLNQIDPTAFNDLNIIINPLRDITVYLRTKVNSIQDRMKSLYFANNTWTIVTDTEQVLNAQNVVLSTGSHPTVMDYEKEKVIPLDTALNPHNLERILKPEDIVGVVGSSHSGILLLKFLSELPFTLAHIYNLYRSPLVYVIDMGTWKLNEFDGLKGGTAEWAQNVLEKNPPANLTRVLSNAITLKATLEQCSRVVYATGFEQNELPAINDIQPITATHAGMIAPRLFGIGIAFPELEINPLGDEVNRVGLNSFMTYAQKMIPQWAEGSTLTRKMRKRAEEQLKILTQYTDLFNISLW